MYVNGVKPKEKEVRLPPHDLDAEFAVLGSMIIDPDAILDVMGVLVASDFYNHQNGRVYQAMVDIFNKGQESHNDPIVLGSKFGEEKFFKGDSFDMFYISLVNTVPTSVNARGYAKLVASMVTRRRLIRYATEIANSAYNYKDEIGEVLQVAQSGVLEATKQSGKNAPMTPLELSHQYLDTTINRLSSPGTMSGIETGYHDIDNVLKGLKRKKLYIIAARPGMGKSSLVRGMINNMSIKGSYRCLYFSLEMAGEEIMDMWASESIGEQALSIQSGNVPEGKKEALHNFIGRYSESNVHLYDRGVTTNDIMAMSRRQQIQNGLDYVVVDYLGLIKSPSRKSRYEQVSEVSRFCKDLAVSLDIPVIVLSQLSRSIEQRQDKHPVLSDLRDSGEIEEAADVVMFLYRDEYYNPETTEFPNVCDVDIQKHRGGPKGRPKLYFRGQTSSFHNLKLKQINI